MLTAEDVLNAKFAATKFAYGYDQDEVDDFLDRVVATLRGLESGSPVVDPVTAQTVRDVRFQSTRFREGYDLQQVDDLLDRVRRTLEGGPAASAPPTVPPPPPAAHASTGPAPGVAPGLVAPRPSWWRRLLGG